MLVYLLGIYILTIAIGTIANVLEETLPLESRGFWNKTKEVLLIIFFAIPLMLVINFATLPFVSAKNWLKARDKEIVENKETTTELKEINEV